MYPVDEFITAAEDARLAVVAVAVVVGLLGTRGLPVPAIAKQLVSTSTISRAWARFREMAGLGVTAGGVRFVGNGAGSNGEKAGGGSSAR
jgi:hypothetical protein